MFEYFIIFFLLALISVLFYLLYEKYFGPKGKSQSELYIEAIKDLLDGKQETAFTKLRQVVAEDTSNIDAYLRLGEILRENKKPQQALLVHKDLTLRTGLADEWKAAILKQLYLDYVDLNDLELAEAALKELVSINAKDRWTLIKMLELQEKAQKWDDAYETAVLLLKLEQNKSKKPLASFKFKMGHAQFLKREYHKSRILFKEALGFDPAYVDAYLFVGDSYLEENRLEDAVNFWKKLISAVPDKGHLVLDRLKKALFDLGRYGEIDSICENILLHSPKNATARHCLAEFYEKKGDTEQAEEILVAMIDDSPEDIKPLLELTRIYLEKGEYGRIKDLVKKLEQRLQKKQIAKTGSTAAKV